MEDSVVKSVVNKYQTRSDVGIKKYGVTLDRNDLNFIEWINHLQEELMDATLYLENNSSLVMPNKSITRSTYWLNTSDFII